MNRGLNVIKPDYSQNLAVSYAQSLYTVTVEDFIDKNIKWFSIVVVAIMAMIILLLIKDIRRSRKLVKERENARVEIELANQDKFVFVNKMANYIREPLYKMEHLLTNAKNGTVSIDSDAYIDKMHKYTKDISSVVNNILNMSRFESGQLALQDNNIALNLQGKRVLIVEDNLENMMITCQIMKKYGFEIQTAIDGLQAFEKLNAAPAYYFDAIIMNVENIVTDEYNVAMRIRNINDAQKATIPVVAIVSNSDNDSIILSDETLVNAVISKPFEPSQMLQVFRKIFT